MQAVVYLEHVLAGAQQIVGPLREGSQLLYVALLSLLKHGYAVGLLGHKIEHFLGMRLELTERLSHAYYRLRGVLLSRFPRKELAQIPHDGVDAPAQFTGPGGRGLLAH